MGRTWMAGAAVALVLGLAAAPAWAVSLARAWVSGHGTDAAGCGAPINPCRSLQYTHDNIVGAGGEIDVLDPAGYGAIAITKAISIVNDGVGTAGVQSSSGNGVTINAGPADSVYLRGLNVDGLSEAGSNGIEFDAGRSLTVIGCVVRHFSGNGIALVPQTGAPLIAILNTVSADNGSTGIRYSSLSGVAASVLTIDQAVLVDNTYGVDGQVLGSGTLQLAMGRSVANANSNSGVTINDNVTASFDSDTIDFNGSEGVFVGTLATALISRSTISQNGDNGVDTVDAGAVFSTGDNRLFGNHTGDVLGPAMTTFATK